MIEVNIMGPDEKWKPFWRNFYDYHTAHGHTFEDGDEITKLLAEWRAIDPDVESPLFYFENEQDHLLFMLRWA